MISSQDFERLSAYIDNQLSAREKAALEARLAREPELKATLNELRQTVQALRSLPVVKPPRNFMLSAKQVRAEARRPLFPVLRMATSLAGLLLALVFAGDLIFSRPITMSPAPQPQATTVARSAVLPTEAPPAAAGALPASTELMDQSAPAGTLGAGAAAGSAPAATPPETTTPMSAAVLAAPPVTAGATPATSGAEQPPLAAAAPTAEAGFAPTEQPPEGTALAAQAPAPLAPTQTPAGTEVPAPLTSAPATPAAKSAIPQAAPLAAAPTSAPAEITESHVPAETLTAPAAEVCPAPTAGCVAAPAKPSVPAPALPWRAAEIGLIGLTVVLAVLTWLMRRR